MSLKKYMRLLEDLELYSGVFWIKDIDNPDATLFFKIPTDISGEVNKEGLNLNAKSGITYNHEKLWKELPKSLTTNKPFDYYPRGRVQIKNGIADIFLNPNLLTDDIKKLIINEFNLHSINGVKKVRFHADYSEHYRCYLDR